MSTQNYLMTVYILNKYFKFVVESIEDNGGRVDKLLEMVLWQFLTPVTI